MMIIVVYEELRISNRKITVCSLSDLIDRIASAFALLVRHAVTSLLDVQKTTANLLQELLVLWVTSYCCLNLLKTGTFRNKFITLPVTDSWKKSLLYKHLAS